MNKQELINQMAEAANITKAAAAKALEAFCTGVKDSMRQGQEVRLIGFGSFKPKEVKAKTVRSPRDGSLVDVPASTKVRFTAGKELKDAANA